MKFFPYPALVSLLVLMMACSSVPEDRSTSDVSKLLEDIKTTITPEDTRKERIIKNEIIALGDKTPLRVRAKVFNDQALLVGETLNQATREKLEVIAIRKAKVKKIFNQIEVKNPLPSYKPFADIILNTRVRFALAGVQELDVTNVKFLVDRGKIFLMGLLTEDEANIVVARLRQVTGVKEVIVVFNYID